MQSRKVERSLKFGMEGEVTRKGLKVNSGASLLTVRPVKEAAKNPSVDIFRTVRHYVVNNKVKLQFRHCTPDSNVCLIFLIDSSGSMVKDKQIAFVKGIINETIQKYRGKRIMYAAVVLLNDGASVLVSPTVNAEQVVDKMNGLHSGGKTNMKDGFLKVSEIIRFLKRPKPQFYLYVFTDGKVNKGTTADPFQEAIDAYRTLLRPLKKTFIVDTDRGFVKLKMAARMAEQIGATYIVMH